MKERSDNLTNAQRSQIVWNILTRTGYDNTRKEKVKTKNKINNSMSDLTYNYIIIEFKTYKKTKNEKPNPYIL